MSDNTHMEQEYDVTREVSDQTKEVYQNGPQQQADPTGFEANIPGDDQSDDTQTDSVAQSYHDHVVITVAQDQGIYPRPPLLESFNDEIEDSVDFDRSGDVPDDEESFLTDYPADQNHSEEDDQDIPAEESALTSSFSDESDDDASEEMQAEEILAMMNLEDTKESLKKQKSAESSPGDMLDSSITGSQDGFGSIDDNANDTDFLKSFSLDDINDDSSEMDQSVTFKDTTKIILSRLVLYSIILFIVSKVEYSDKMIRVASFVLAGFALLSAPAIRPLEKLDDVLKRYIRIALAIADMGVAMLLIYMSGSSGNLLMLSLPLITFTNGFYGINFQLAFIAMISTILYYLADIAIGDSGIDSFDYRIGFYVQMGVMVWLISWHYVLEWYKQRETLRYEFLKGIENCLDKLPKPIMEKLAVLFNVERLRGIEHKYQTKMGELLAVLEKKDSEIAFYKENLQNSDAGEDYAVNEINSMLELENLSLKENNKKLMELNKSLESRVQMLTSELDIANTELERVYNSINEEETGSEESDEGEVVVETIDEDDDVELKPGFHEDVPADPAQTANE